MRIRSMISGIALVAATLSMLTANAQPKQIKLGMVAKSQSNAVFQAARAGAEAAAKELGPKYGAEVTIDWQTPPDEDAQKQAQAVGALWLPARIAMVPLSPIVLASSLITRWPQARSSVP